MAVNHDPVFAAAGRTVTAVATAAKTTYNDAANAVLLCTAHATAGSLLKALSAMPRATVTASKLQLYISFDGGTTLWLISSVRMVGYDNNVGATIATPITTFADITEETPIRLPAGSSLYVATAVAVGGGIVFAGQVEDLAA